MEGFDVLTFDGEKAGKVVGRQGDYLLVQQGAIFKHRRGLPAVCATVDESERVVRTTLSRSLIESAPSVGGRPSSRTGASASRRRRSSERPRTGGSAPGTAPTTGPDR